MESSSVFKRKIGPMTFRATHIKSIGIVNFQIHRQFYVSTLKSADYAVFLITSKVLDVRRRGATTEAYGVIRRKPAPAKAGGGAIEGNAVLRLCSGP